MGYQLPTLKQVSEVHSSNFESLHEQIDEKCPQLWWESGNAVKVQSWFYEDIDSSL